MDTKSSLNGQLAVITGANRGIGAAIAHKLASLGAHVVLTARDRQRLSTVADEIAATGGSAEAIACDLSDPAQIESFARKVLDRHKHCDILVNNAGMGWFGGPLHTMAPAEWENLIAINLRAPYLLLGAFAPSMIEAKRGHIINISSLASKNPVPNAAAYAGSKWGLNGMMISAAEELRQHQVRVSLIEPGSVRTEFGAGLSSEKSPLGAIAPEDIAEDCSAPGDPTRPIIHQRSDGASYPQEVTVHCLAHEPRDLPLLFCSGVVCPLGSMPWV